MKRKMKCWTNRALLLLFPPKCVGCGELMSVREGEREVFCPFCRTRWEQARLPLEDTLTDEASSILGIASVVEYQPGHNDGVAERLIYHIKHKDHNRVFDFAAKEMHLGVERLIREKQIDEKNLWISYPPRRKTAVRKDGFDQAHRLAKALSLCTGWPMKSLLIRAHDKKEQKTLGREARVENAMAAYELGNRIPSLEGKTIVLIDDLYTTGATLRACAKLLSEAGADGMVLVTIARTRSPKP